MNTQDLEKPFIRQQDDEKKTEEFNDHPEDKEEGHKNEGSEYLGLVNEDVKKDNSEVTPIDLLYDGKNKIVNKRYLTKFHSLMVKNLCGWEEGKLDLIESGLLITAMGLGIERILMYLIELYSRSKGIVFLLNTSAQELLFLKDWIREVNLDGEQSAELDRVHIMSAETSRNERVKIYQRGGVISITSRILIVDMLDGSLPIASVTNIIVNHGEKIIDSSVGKFILKLYNDKKNDGIIRVISDEPRAFTGGIIQLERAMKALQQTKLMLWPRFRIEVGTELNKGVVELNEIRIPLTKLLKEIQEGLVECVELSIKELRRLNPTVDLENVVLEEALFPDFDSYVKMQFLPVWHRISSKTKKIISELRLLRRLLIFLLSMDCVSFYSTLKTITVADLRERAEQSDDDPTAQPHSWLMLDIAQSVLILSRERLYKKVGDVVKTVLEEPPKWKVLRKIITSIKKDRIKKESNGKHPGNVLIVVESSYTASQIFQLLNDSKSPPNFLSSLLIEHFSWNSALDNFPKIEVKPEKPEIEQKSKRRRIRENKIPNIILDEEDYLLDESATMFVSKQLSKNLTTSKSNDNPAVNSGSLEKPPDMIDDYILIWSLKNNTLDSTLSGMYGDEDARVLETFKPQYIVMYDPNLGFIRRVEIYRTLFPDFPIEIYSLLYNGSIEEQRYLFQIRKERTAFEKLIKDSANISIPLNYQQDKRAPRPSESFLWDAIDSRELSSSNDAGTVVVDIREFRSPLPFALYEQNVRLLPCTLEVGDYIISPQIVIERKSISDLLQSLSSGRLYSQASAMCHHYEIPILLIEWNKDQPFSLKYDHHIRGEVSSKETHNKIVLLCVAFPKLRILWSSSPEASAEMIIDLKKNQDEPDINTAIQMSVEGPGNFYMDFSITPVDILRSLPSVTSRNYRYIITKASSLKILVQKSRDWFETILGKSPGFLLWSFINHCLKYDYPESNSKLNI